MISKSVTSHIYKINKCYFLIIYMLAANSWTNVPKLIKIKWQCSELLFNAFEVFSFENIEILPVTENDYNIEMTYQTCEYYCQNKKHVTVKLYFPSISMRFTSIKHENTYEAVAPEAVMHVISDV